MRLLDFLLSLFYVPKCVSCGLRLPPESEVPLCSVCRADYENEKLRTCSVCSSRLSDCTCRPVEVKFGTAKMIKLFRYRPAHPELAASRMIFALKHRPLAMLVRYFARDLLPSVERLVGDRQSEFVITYPPRSHEAIRKYGFDHTAMLAKELGKQTGIRVCSALRRIGGGVQKKLSRTQRLKNAMDSFAPREDVSLKGLRVLLVDDVITTGATLAAAARHLRRMGAKEVVTVALAVTLREEKLPEDAQPLSVF